MNSNMENSQPFTLRVFVASGDPDGLRVVERSNWVGKALVFPRTLLAALKRRSEFDQTGVYILTGPAEDGETIRVYMGEGDPVKPRLEAHHSGKDFWTNCAMFVSTPGHLNKAHVQYLEARLIDIARSTKRAEIDNINNPTLPSLSEADIADMDVFLSNMLGMFPLLGIDAFERPQPPRDRSRQLTLDAKSIKAFGAETTQGFTVLKGSQAVAQVTNSYRTNAGNQLRETLLRSGVLSPLDNALRFNEDYTFTSPSLAASIVLGNSTNGRWYWKDSQGRSLKQLQEAEANA